jgi:RNA polymerase sigma-70 factor (ECF subfamily)
MSVACAPEAAVERQELGELDRPAATPEPVQGRRLDPQRLGDHAARLYRAAYGLCGSREDAEDLVQSTYERILRRPRFVRHENDLAYLLQVMRNTWISSGRGRRYTVVPIDTDEVDAIADPHADAAMESVQAAAIYDLLRELSEPLREALVAVDVLGLSYKEAARALGTKEGTIMSRLHRGRSQMAARIAVD